MPVKDNDKLRRVMAESYALMNRDGRFARHATQTQDVGLFQALLDAVDNVERLPVLDFGCGPDGGIKDAVAGATVVPYDPYVMRYAAGPWVRPYAAVYSSDVLEHMLPGDILTFARDADCNGTKLIYLEIATRPANTLLTNGLNAHVTLRASTWWFGWLCGALHANYAVALASDNMLDEVCTLAFLRKDA